MATIKAAVVQHACTHSYDENMHASIKGIEAAAAQQADLVLSPELNSSHYFCITEDPENYDLAESIPGKTSERLSALAKKHNIIIITTVFEKRAKGIYHNTAIVLDKDGSLAGTYRKMHIPDDPGFYEKYYFTPGDQGFIPIDTSIGRLGVLICWDQWYPEAARIMALSGAEILLYPSAIGWEPDEVEDEKQRQLNAWVNIQKGHAIANNLPLICSNRIGLESADKNETLATQFWGSSFILGQQGEMLVEASPDKETLIVADIDLTRTEQIRHVWPYFRDRRIEHYDGILQRYIGEN